MNAYQVKHGISLGLSLFGIGVALLGSRSAQEWCMWIGFALIFIAGIINMTIRCPKCGRSLVRKRWSVPKFCPECGEPITGSKYED